MLAANLVGPAAAFDAGPNPAAAHGNVARLPAVAPQQNRHRPNTGGPSDTPSVISRRVSDRVRYAFALAQRGAVFSARAELREALKVCTLALDTQAGDQRYSSAVREGLTALSEADDFAPSEARLESRLDIRSIVTSHRTQLLKHQDTSRFSALDALQAYYDYAQDRLVFGCGNQKSAATVLYGMAKVQTALASRTPLAVPKAMALYQTVMMIDPHNYMAANELGVLLARHGRLTDAERLLRHSVAISSHPESWMNLAKVFTMTGRPDEAAFARARHEEAVAANKGQDRVSEDFVRFVDLETFAGSSMDDTLIPAAVASKAAADQLPDMAPAQKAQPRNKATKSTQWLPTTGLKRLAGILKSDPKRKSPTNR